MRSFGGEIGSFVVYAQHEFSSYPLVSVLKVWDVPKFCTSVVNQSCRIKSASFRVSTDQMSG
jgi:hypothetical protein